MWPGRTQNVICLAKGNKGLCRLLQFSLRVDTLIVVLIPSNQSLNIDHTTGNFGKRVTSFSFKYIYSVR